MKIVGIQKYNLLDDGTIRTSAVDWWRMINPLTNLKKLEGFDIDILDNPNFDSNPDRKYSALGVKYDLIMTSYIDTPIAYSYLCAVRHKFRVQQIMDLDDNIYEIDRFNPAYERYHIGTKEMFTAHQIIKDVPHLIVTNDHLKTTLERFGRRNPTYVIPNYIDPTVYKMDWSKLNRSKKTINIVYQGSSTHFRDLTESGYLEACSVIAKEYKSKVKFTFIGMDYDDLHEMIPKKNLNIVYGKNHFWDWIPLWQREMAKADITVAPLIDTQFNQNKSHIKFLEGSVAKLPMVLSNVTPYKQIVKHNETGFLVDNDPESWYEHLTMLIENKTLRRKLGDSAYKYVMVNHTIQQHVHKYAEIFNNICKTT